MKKLVALLIALILVMSVCSAFAEEQKTIAFLPPALIRPY